MIDNNKKIAKFVQAITAHAQAQSRQIHEEVEAFKAQRLAQAEQAALQESAALIHREREEVSDRLKQELSQREFERRGALIRRRQELADQVMEDARGQLDAYTATPAYTEWLCRSFTAMRDLLPAQGTTYYLSERDRTQEAALAPLCPAGSEVAYVDDIRLGGIRGVNPAAGLLADDTLDTRLEQQRDWFVQTIGLTIKPV